MSLLCGMLAFVWKLGLGGLCILVPLAAFGVQDGTRRDKTGTSPSCLAFDAHLRQDELILVLPQQ